MEGKGEREIDRPHVRACKKEREKENYWKQNNYSMH